MKALVYETANTIENFPIELREIAEPTLREGDVLVDIRAIGINPGEAFFRQVRSAEPGGYVLLGFEFSGVVTEVGRSVEGFKIGDRVFGTGDLFRDGAYAERLAIDHRIIAKLPASIPFDQGASLAVGAITATEAMFRDQDTLPAGVKTVMIIGGAGAIGSLATQVLKATTSAFVIATGSRPESRDWCTRMGADLVIDHRGDIPAQLAAAGIHEVDMVLSTAGTAENLGSIASIIRPYGHIAFVDPVPPLDLGPMGPLGGKAPSLHVEMMFCRIVNNYQPERQGRFLQKLAALTAEGRVKPIMTTRLEGLTAENMKIAHEMIELGRTIGKIVVAP